MLARRLLHEHERERLAWERERRMLVTTLCHLSGRPLPPDEPAGTDRDGQPSMDELLGLMPDLEQQPDY